MTTVFRERIPTPEPERLVLEVSNHKGVPVVHCGGELDIYTSPWFEDLIKQRLTLGQQSIVVDLSGVNYIDGSFFGALIRVLRQAKNLGGNICLVIAIEQNHIHKVFEITNLNQIFDHRHDLETARQLLS